MIDCLFVQSCVCFKHPHRLLAVLSSFRILTCLTMNSSPGADGRKVAWRAGREGAVKLFNTTAALLGVDLLPHRPSSDQMTKFWQVVCDAAELHHHDDLKVARNIWIESHGGGDLPDEILVTEADDSPDASEFLEAHRMLCDGTPAGASKKKEFRIKSKAFLLTFNSDMFIDTKEFFETFEVWVRARAKSAQATQWSAAVERSLHSAAEGRLHLHAYFSWLGPNTKGVNSRNTDDWVFAGVRPRVDVNTEMRGGAHWLKAVQRGHFYCSVHKKGALFTCTNYPPWDGVWVPDAAWVVTLYRQHKLDHDKYLHLSALLRDGHERRKASVEAVRATEQTITFAQERALARAQIQAKALPFKLLRPEVERWMMHYEEMDERYKMLVLYGPSQTGKTRLARALYGDDRTLVVDVQHAEHPDLRTFRRHQHKAVLLDEVKGPSFIVNNKKLLQAHVDGAILGQSATQLYTYEVFLWRTPIIISTNNWCMGGLTGEERDWLAANCIVVHVTEKVYSAKRKRV